MKSLFDLVTVNVTQLIKLHGLICTGKLMWFTEE